MIRPVGIDIGTSSIKLVELQDKNGKLDFPIKSFQFEPIAVAKGVINIDEVSLEPLN